MSRPSSLTLHQLRKFNVIARRRRLYDWMFLPMLGLALALFVLALLWVPQS